MKSRIIGDGSSGISSGVQEALEAVFATNILRRTIHDASAVAIQGSGGSFVAFGDGAAVGVTGKMVVVSSTIGQPLQISAAANAGAAAASTKRFYINQGEGPTTFPFQLAAGDLLWIRSLSSTGATGGYVTLNIGG